MTITLGLFQSKEDLLNNTYEIMVGDALENAKKIETGSITLINTDPPFDVSGGTRITKRHQKIIQGKIFDWEIEDYDEYMKNLFAEFWRILKPDGNLVLFYSWHKFENEDNFVCKLKKLGFFPKNIINIVKKNPPPHIMRNNLRSSCELGFWFSKSAKNYKFTFLEQRKMRNCFVYDQNVGQKDTTHPAEKPIWIYENIVKMFTDKGDLVYDGFLGSGTTLLACINTERSCIGSEINGKYIKLIQKRTDNYFKTRSLFGEDRPKLKITGNLKTLNAKKPKREETLKKNKNQCDLTKFI